MCACMCTCRGVAGASGHALVSTDHDSRLTTLCKFETGKVPAEEERIGGVLDRVGGLDREQELGVASSNNNTTAHVVI